MASSRTRRHRSSWVQRGFVRVTIEGVDLEALVPTGSGPLGTGGRVGLTLPIDQRHVVPGHQPVGDVSQAGRVIPTAGARRPA